MRFQAGIQILLVIIAIVIVVTAIKPKFAEISFNQNEIAEYESALNKANEYNVALRELINKANSIPRSDQVALLRYLPNTIDPVLVSRDIYNIVSVKNGLWLLEIEEVAATEVTSGIHNKGDTEESDGFVSNSSLLGEAQSDLIAQRFKVQAIGTYEQVKALLSDLEKNTYPLRIMNFSFQTNPDSILHRFEFELETYAFGEVNENTN